MKAARIVRQTAAVAGASGDGWGSKRPAAKLASRARAGMSKDDIFMDKCLKTHVMAERRARHAGLVTQVEDIMAHRDDPFFPHAPIELTGWPKYKYLIWEVVELTDEPSVCARSVTTYVLGLVALSSIISIINTLPTLRIAYAGLWRGLEFFFMINFSFELGLRFISCPSKWKFWQEPLNWVDAVVVLPFWFEEGLVVVTGGSNLPNLTFVRLLRLGKGLRLVKLGRYNRGVRMLKDSLVNSIDAMQLFLVILLLSMVFCASTMYFSERGSFYGTNHNTTDLYFRTYNRGSEEKGRWELVDSDCWDANYTGMDTDQTDCERAISPFQSVPHSMWFVLITLMTVGYGEIVPITYWGQVSGMFTVLVGIIMLVLPLSIIQSSFVDERRRMKVEEQCEKDYQLIRQIVELDHEIDEDGVVDEAELLESAAVDEEAVKIAKALLKNESDLDDQMLLPTLVCLLHNPSCL